jgi:hypothetical protein
MTNVEFLQDAGILPKDMKLSRKERAAIEKLTPADLKFLVSTRDKVRARVEGVDMLIAPPTHHF